MRTLSSAHNMTSSPRFRGICQKTALCPTSSVPRMFSWSLDFKVTSAGDLEAKNGPAARWELPRGHRILGHTVPQPWNGLSSTEVNKPHHTQRDGEEMHPNARPSGRCSRPEATTPSSSYVPCSIQAMSHLGWKK